MTLKVKQINSKLFTPSASTDLVTVEYLQNSGKILADVLDIQTSDVLDPSAAPTDGDRYVLTDVSNLNANFGTITDVANGDIVQYSSDSSAFEIVFDASVKGTESFLVTNKADGYFYLWDQSTLEWFNYDAMVSGLKATDRLAAKTAASHGQAIGISADGTQSDIVYLSPDALFDDITPATFSDSYTHTLSYSNRSKVIGLTDTLGIFMFANDGVSSIMQPIGLASDGTVTVLGSGLTMSDYSAFDYMTGTRISNTLFVAMYYDDTADDHVIQVYSVDAAGTLTAEGTAYAFGGSTVEFGEIVQIEDDSDIFIVAANVDGATIMQSFNIDISGSTYAVTSIDAVELDIMDDQRSLKMVSSGLAAVAGLNTNDRTSIQTITVDTGTGSLGYVDDIDLGGSASTPFVMMESISLSDGVFAVIFPDGDVKMKAVLYQAYEGSDSWLLTQLDSATSIYSGTLVSPVAYSTITDDNYIYVSYVDDDSGSSYVATFGVQYDSDEEIWLGLEVIGTEEQVLEPRQTGGDYFIAADIDQFGTSGNYVTFTYEYGRGEMIAHTLQFDPTRNNFAQKVDTEGHIDGIDIFGKPNTVGKLADSSKGLFWHAQSNKFAYIDRNYDKNVKSVGDASELDAIAFADINTTYFYTKAIDNDYVALIGIDTTNDTLVAALLSIGAGGTLTQVGSKTTLATSVETLGGDGIELISDYDKLVFVAGGVSTTTTLYMVSFDRSTGVATLDASLDVYAGTTVYHHDVRILSTGFAFVTYVEYTGGMTYGQLVTISDITTSPSMTLNGSAVNLIGDTDGVSQFDVLEVDTTNVLFMAKTGNGEHIVRLIDIDTGTGTITPYTYFDSFTDTNSGNHLSQLFIDTSINSFGVLYGNSTDGGNSYNLNAMFGSYDTTSVGAGYTKIINNVKSVIGDDSIRRNNMKFESVGDNEYVFTGVSNINTGLSGTEYYISYFAIELNIAFNTLTLKAHDILLTDDTTDIIRRTNYNFAVTPNGYTLICCPLNASYLVSPFNVDISPNVSARQLAANSGSTPTSLDKKVAASLTTADGDTTGVSITGTPIGYVQIFVNTDFVFAGDGVTTGDCYFSTDGGATALTLDSIEAGATLYWNGSVAGYELDTDDYISFVYNV